MSAEAVAQTSSAWDAAIADHRVVQLSPLAQPPGPGVLDAAVGPLAMVDADADAGRLDGDAGDPGGGHEIGPPCRQRPDQGHGHGRQLVGVKAHFGHGYFSSLPMENPRPRLAPRP